MSFFVVPGRRSALAGAVSAACVSFFPCPAVAQAAPPAPPATASAPSSATPAQLDRVIVTGNPLRSNDLAAPATALEGDALVRQRGSSLGETLDSQPGMSSSWFGPNANRPMIRGLDGDRVKVLNNAGNSFDASSLSFDHAVPIDPLAVERIEVLRGPAALMYGGSAVGGVVNTIDNRIPKASIADTGGAAELRVGGAAGERGGAALVETGNGRWALHADAFGRETSDLKVPRFTPREDGEALAPTDRVRNSASRASGGAFGASFTGAQGYVGLAVDRYDSRYGVVAEPDVTIRMQREQVSLAGELRPSDGPWRNLRFQLHRSDYEHREIEGSGEVGTTFASQGDELRLEAEHAAWAGWRGLVGLQLERSDFSALGEEAFVPRTTTRKQGAFVFEQTEWRFGSFSAGARVENVRIESAGDAEPGGPFGAPAQRRLSLASASIANLWSFAPSWSLATTWSHTERAPTSFELFANGAHAATGAFEVGDPTLGAERSHNLDLALLWSTPASRVRAGVFEARFSRFIALAATGVTVEQPGEDGGLESLPEYRFRAVRARLRGVEIEASHRVELGRWSLTNSAQLDFTRGDDLDAGEPLPRIAPLRLRLGLEAQQGPWTAGIELTHAARQSRVPSTDVATASYTLVQLALSRRFNLGERDALWFVKLENAGDTLARSASTIRTVRDLAPLPGRALKTGVRISF